MSHPTFVFCPRVSSARSLRIGAMSAAKLRQQLLSLMEDGYRFENYDASLSSYDSSSLILCFADGSLNFAEEALPVIFDLQIPATLFVAANMVGRSEKSGFLKRKLKTRLSWLELKSLEDAGIDIQCSGFSGAPLAYLDDEIIFGDLIRARREMENRMDKSPCLLLNDSEVFSPATLDLVDAAGFKMVICPGSKPPFPTALQLGAVKLRAFESGAALLRRINSWKHSSSDGLILQEASAEA